MTTDPDLPETFQPVTLATTAEMANAYAGLTDDFNPIHLDPDFAAATPFGRPIIHGTMALNLVLIAAGRSLGPRHRPGRLDVRFARPVPVGATIRAGGRLAGASYEVFVEMADGTRAIEGTLDVEKVHP